SSSDADIKIEGDDVGSLHCLIHLTLKKRSSGRGSTWARIVEIKQARTRRWKTSITPAGNANSSSKLSDVLTPGAVVTFGSRTPVSYRYLAPEHESPEHWLNSNFTWDGELEPAYGGGLDDTCAVYMVRTKDEKETRLALKTMWTADFAQDPDLKTMVHRERELLEQMEHKNVIKLLAYREDLIEGLITFVFPEMTGGNLFNFTKARRTSPLQQFRLSNVLAPFAAKEILSGLKYLHSLDIVHRDMKPENILVEGSWSEGDDQLPRIVLADFGFSRSPGEVRLERFTAGTRDWIAPRSFREDNVDDYPIDLWGLGLIIWFM
ncbi:hypothetical protein FRB90_009771, partial [Tulasnella sp. 427]